jgi:hypothetical protein
MELGKFEAGAAGENGGERQARGLAFEFLPARAECTPPFAVNGRHAIYGRDEQRTEHQKCSELAVDQQMRDGPKRHATKARMTRDPRDAIDRQLAINLSRGVCVRQIQGPEADYSQKKFQKHENNREPARCWNCRPSGTQGATRQATMNHPSPAMLSKAKMPRKGRSPSCWTRGKHSGPATIK